MGARKIVDEGEVIRWFEEGRTYAWMVDEYKRKYDLEMAPSAFGNFRRRKGLTKRIERNDDLIPWAVAVQHRWQYPLSMLRAEARKRAGLEMAESMSDRLEKWHRVMERDNTVVHYDPETLDGFFYVERRDGVDHDLIREPDRKTTKRRSSGD